MPEDQSLAETEVDAVLEEWALGPLPPAPPAAPAPQWRTIIQEEAPPPPPDVDSSDRRASRARLLNVKAFADLITQPAPAPARGPVDELDARLTINASLTRTCCCAHGRSIVVCSVSCADAAAAGVVVRLYGRRHAALLFVDAHASPLEQCWTRLVDDHGARKATCVFDAPPASYRVVASAVDRAGRDVRGLEASCSVDAPDDDDDCCFLGWLFPNLFAPPSLELQEGIDLV